ncbi:hypothetical protein KP509_13G063500 [Ceratopteris richardii]|nr:hypothetical protein KP509_13G063500 [Ceratopteris richardii]
MLPSKNFPTDHFLNSTCIWKPIFLGVRGETDEPLFAVDVTGVSSEYLNQNFWPEGSEWVDLRKYGSELSSADAGLLAYARGMVEWHTKNKFCSQCGGKMEIKEAGHSLQCISADCGRAIYPRLDPAVIVLVTCGDYLLLGRQSRWEPGRYSLLAGFIEVGETFEMAVAREVHEESGVRVKIEGMRYIASQPWPFPQSLMVGFIAEAEEKQASLPEFVDDVVPVGSYGVHLLAENLSLPAIAVDMKELEDARWVHRSRLKAVLENKQTHGGGPFSVPGRHAIANHLMQEWTKHKNGTESEWAGDTVPYVDIDEGVFKYVLIQVNDDMGNKKLIVRGDKSMAYHSDIFKHTRQVLMTLGLQAEVLGGGRISHDVAERSIHVYGFSQAYGRANHAVTATLLRQWFPFHAVSFSWDGY